MTAYGSRFSDAFAVGAYWDRLEKLATRFEYAVELGVSSRAPYAWDFLDEYNPAELRWLYENQPTTQRRAMFSRVLQQRKQSMT
jgi:hypothetical protein